jgi:anaerobic selenocysteine-containing dehydrogenase
MGVVHASKGSLTPISDQLKSEITIVCELAAAVLGNESKINWQQYTRHYDAIRSDIEQVIPGFINYNQRIQEPNGFYLPNAARNSIFNTNNGNAKFTISQFEGIALREDELLMMTIRSHDQFNTTIYGLNDRYRGVHNE